MAVYQVMSWKLPMGPGGDEGYSDLGLPASRPETSVVERLLPEDEEAGVPIAQGTVRPPVRWYLLGRTLSWTPNFSCFKANQGWLGLMLLA